MMRISKYPDYCAQKIPKQTKCDLRLILWERVTHVHQQHNPPRPDCDIGLSVFVSHTHTTSYIRWSTSSSSQSPLRKSLKAWFQTQTPCCLNTPRSKEHSCGNKGRWRGGKFKTRRANISATLSSVGDQSEAQSVRATLRDSLGVVHLLQTAHNTRHNSAHTTYHHHHQTVLSSGVRICSHNRYIFNGSVKSDIMKASCCVAVSVNTHATTTISVQFTVVYKHLEKPVYAL